jgi:hypothetical protein
VATEWAQVKSAIKGRYPATIQPQSWKRHPFLPSGSWWDLIVATPHAGDCALHFPKRDVPQIWGAPEERCVPGRILSDSMREDICDFFLKVKMYCPNVKEWTGTHILVQSPVVPFRKAQREEGATVLGCSIIRNTLLIPGAGLEGCWSYLWPWELLVRVMVIVIDNTPSIPESCQVRLFVITLFCSFSKNDKCTRLWPPLTCHTTFNRCALANQF